jgi:hypothetical protein
MGNKLPKSTERRRAQETEGIYQIWRYCKQKMLPERLGAHSLQDF